MARSSHSFERTADPMVFIIDGKPYTLQADVANSIEQAIANGTWSGFRKVRLTGKYNFGYAPYQPPKPGGGEASMD